MSFHTLGRLLLLGLWAAAGVMAAPKGCFDDTQLPTEDRKKAVDILWHALDREALFTYAGGLKPTSIGFFATRISALGDEGLEEIEQVRRLMPAFGCPGLFAAELHHSNFVVDGKRYMQSVVFHLPHLQSALRRHADVFAPYGITPNTNPMEVMLAIQYARGGDSSLMLGNILGYPTDAVDFFYASSREQSRTGQFVRRSFLSPPVFKNLNHFVWVVPEEHSRSAAEEQVFVCAEEVLSAYKERRERYFGEGKAGPFALLRDWHDEGFPQCGAALHAGDEEEGKR